MKNRFFFIVLILTAIALLHVHVIRLEDDFDIIAKDGMTLRGTYVDVRDWGPADYLSCAPRIRNHLICERHYPEFINRFDNALKELTKRDRK